MMFRPLPLLSNPHVQTILGTLLGGSLSIRARTHLVPLPDGDQIMVHETLTKLDVHAPLAVLVHGLGGSSDSSYMLRMTERLTQQGWRVFRMDLRGAGLSLPLAKRIYTAACSDDLRAVVGFLGQAHPDVPIALVGFSLGGNIVLKLAGELGASPGPVAAVAAIAPPIDLVRCSEMIHRQRLYDAWYVHHLVKQVREHRRFFPELPKVTFPRHTTLRHFDDIYTSPRWGYSGWQDYYAQASSAGHIANIRVPTYILTARDDPFVAVEPFEALQAPPAVEVHISAHGGHLGFLGRDETGGIRWSETQVANWLAARLHRLRQVAPHAI